MNTYPTTQKVRQLTNTKKRSFFLSTANTYRIQSGWSGGSRSYFSLIDFHTGKDLELKGLGDQFSKMPIETEMPLNSLLIETGISCGKSSTPHITCRPEQEEEVKKYLGII